MTPSVSSNLIPGSHLVPEQIDAEAALLKEALLEMTGCPQASAAAWSRLDADDHCWRERARQERPLLEQLLLEAGAVSPEDLEPLLDQVRVHRELLLLDKVGAPFDPDTGLEWLLASRAAFFLELTEILQTRVQHYQTAGQYDLAQQISLWQEKADALTNDALAALLAYRDSRPPRPGVRSAAEFRLIRQALFGAAGSTRPQLTIGQRD